MWYYYKGFLCYYEKCAFMKAISKILAQLHMDEPSQVRKELRWLWDRMLRCKHMVVLVCVIGLVSTLMGLGSSVATKYMIDAVIGRTEDLLMAAILVIGMTLGGFGLQALSSRIGATVHVRVRNDNQSLTFGKILHAGWEALEPYRSGDLLHRLETDVNTVSDGVITFFPNLLSSVTRFAGSLIIMLAFDPTMALIALLGVPVTLVVSRYQMRMLRNHSMQMKALGSEVMSFQEDSFRNLTSIKAFSIMDQFEDEMHRLQGKYQNAYLSYNAHQINMNTLFSLVSLLVSGGCFGWAVFRLWTGDISYGSMTMFLQLATSLRSSFSALVSIANTAVTLTTSAGRLLAVEELPAEKDEIPAGLREEQDLTVEMNQVHFRYVNGEVVLHPFDFCAHSGELIAITGPSGEGKTTLLRLILGLVEPCSGEASVVGRSGTRYAITAGTRGVFAYVPQGNSVFAGTIAQNLRLVAPDATDEELVKALKIACAYDFVQQLPDGLNHRLGAGGRGISEGQAQRLAIARALLRKAPVLLLDEATSALDVETERRLMDNLRSSGIINTCILVTHRPSSAEFCNRAYEIRNGFCREVNYES
jgi:ABC-type multidrug transport system fused ATPase/permease subunit